MKNITELLASYKSVHMNPNNVVTHFIGVPMILWSIALLLSAIEFEVNIQGNLNSFSIMPICALLVFFYYLLLHPTLGLLSIILLTPIYYLASLYTHHPYFYYLVIGFFFIGWCLQFLGHYYEKAKPAFIDDIRQLFVGPLFLVAEIYFYLGFGKNLYQQINQIAKQKRNNLTE